MSTEGDHASEADDDIDTQEGDERHEIGGLCLEQRVVYQGEGDTNGPWLADTLGNGVPELWLAPWDEPEARGLERVGERYEPYAGEVPGYIASWADVDGSGRDDVIAAPGTGGSEWPAKLSNTQGVPKQSLTLALPKPSGNEPMWLLGFLDATRDGRADFFTVENGRLQLWRGDGTGGFSASSELPLLPPWRAATMFPRRALPQTLALTLIDCGRSTCAQPIDLVMITPEEQLIRVATSDGFSSPEVLDIWPFGSADRLGIVVEHGAVHERTVELLAQQEGRLVTLWRSPTLDAAVTADLDGDGRLEVLWSRERQGYLVSALPNDGDPLAVQIDLLVDTPERRVVHLVADLDGDGRDEIVQFHSDHLTHTIEIIEAVDCN